MREGLAVCGDRVRRRGKRGALPARGAAALFSRRGRFVDEFRCLLFLLLASFFSKHNRRLSRESERASRDSKSLEALLARLAVILAKRGLNLKKARSSELRSVSRHSPHTSDRDLFQKPTQLHTRPHVGTPPASQAPSPRGDRARSRSYKMNLSRVGVVVVPVQNPFKNSRAGDAFNFCSGIYKVPEIHVPVLCVCVFKSVPEKGIPCWPHTSERAHPLPPFANSSTLGSPPKASLIVSKERPRLLSQNPSLLPNSPTLEK